MYLHRLINNAMKSLKAPLPLNATAPLHVRAFLADNCLKNDQLRTFLATIEKLLQMWRNKYIIMTDRWSRRLLNQSGLFSSSVPRLLPGISPPQDHAPQTDRHSEASDHWSIADRSVICPGKASLSSLCTCLCPCLPCWRAHVTRRNLIHRSPSVTCFTDGAFHQ